MKRILLFALVLTMLPGLAVLSFAADEKRYDIPIGDSPVLGPMDAPVTIIEFLDFQ